jgi:hypothetical protein
MKKYIVTTTIQAPTEATLKFANMDGWQLIVVGDIKTPHEEYKKINCIYLHPDDQEKKYKEVSDTLGWRTIQRRNIGFIEAYNLGADVLATVDDDNIPYDNWGQNVYVGKTIEIDLYDTKLNVADPLSVTNRNDLWHRGYPLEYLSDKNNVEYLGKSHRHVLIQSDLWDGDPDIDAICRLSKKPIVKFDITKPYGFTKQSPFNSQNTFISREVLPYYMMLPYVGRMDDIWGSYIVQQNFVNNVIYCPATVYQQRNVQDLVKNLENEIVGYRKTIELVNKPENTSDLLPEQTKKFIEAYRKAFEEIL